MKRVWFLLILLPLLFTGCSSTVITLTTTVTKDSPVVPATGPQLELVSSSFDVTETNSMWWRYSWKITLRNNSNRVVTASAKLQWLNGSGYEVDTDNEYNIIITANSSETITGSSLILLPQANTIDSLKITIK